MYLCFYASYLDEFFLFLMFFGSGNPFQLVTNAWPSRMTLKLKVTWCCAWPSLTLVVFVLERWFFVCVIRKGHTFVTSWNGFLDSKNIRNKKNSIVLGQTQPKLVKVTYNITWPWVPRSSVKVTFLWPVGMCSLTQKTLETKKFHRSRTNTARVSKDHVQHHVTLSFKVIRKGHAFVTSWNVFLDSKTLETKKFLSF